MCEQHHAKRKPQDESALIVHSNWDIGSLLFTIGLLRRRGQCRKGLSLESVYLGQRVISDGFDRIVALGEVLGVNERDILETGEPQNRQQIDFVKVHDLRRAIGSVMECPSGVGDMIDLRLHR